MPERTYAEDLELLSNHTEIVELRDADSRLAVAPQWQGRAMTSTLAGEGAGSFGWLNEAFIASGGSDAAFNNYGGEDRFWLGPEGGQFGLWFDPGTPFDLEHWRTPAALNEQAFPVTSRDDRSVAMATQLSVRNYAGATFTIGVKRTIRMLDRPAAADALGEALPESLAMVAFESENILANDDAEAWLADDGLLSVWILGQFKPLPRGKVLVPIRPGSPADLGPPARTDYFGEIPDDRCRVTDRYIWLACDGRYRCKIGVSPRRSRALAASYDPDAPALTVVQFNQPVTAAELPYVNSLWQHREDPFAGDAINAYNDGPPSPGAEQLGPFYELETSSPAAVLQPGQSITHIHRTMHFSGDEAQLASLAEDVLGIDPGDLL